LLVFIVCGFLILPGETALDWDKSWKNEIFLPAFAVSFVFVTFSYSGWNAAAYIVDEIKDVRKNLPKALVLGTLVVSILYVLLNIVFLRQASLDQLQGQIEIGQIASNNIFGNKGGFIISMAIAFMLISSISAMIWAGPRVIHTMAEDYLLWNYFKFKNKNNIPVRAILLQSGIAIFKSFCQVFECMFIHMLIYMVFGMLMGFVPVTGNE